MKLQVCVNYSQSQRNYENSEKQQTLVHQCMDTHKHVRIKLGWQLLVKVF